MKAIDRTRAKNGLTRGSRAILRIVRIVGKRVDMKPLDLAVRDAFLAEVRRRGVAAEEV